MTYLTPDGRSRSRRSERRRGTDCSTNALGTGDSRRVARLAGLSVTKNSQSCPSNRTISPVLKRHAQTPSRPLVSIGVSSLSAPRLPTRASPGFYRAGTGRDCADNTQGRRNAKALAKEHARRSGVISSGYEIRQSRRSVHGVLPHVGDCALARPVGVALSGANMRKVGGVLPPARRNYTTDSGKPIPQHYVMRVSESMLTTDDRCAVR